MRGRAIAGLSVVGVLAPLVACGLLAPEDASAPAASMDAGGFDAGGVDEGLLEAATFDVEALPPFEAGRDAAPPDAACPAAFEGTAYSACIGDLHRCEYEAGTCTCEQQLGTCRPVTCADLGGCGDLADGCGGVLHCTMDCTLPCVARGCEGRCGSVGNGCGHLLTCEPCRSFTCNPLQPGCPRDPPDAGSCVDTSQRCHYVAGGCTSDYSCVGGLWFGGITGCN